MNDVVDVPISVLLRNMTGTETCDTYALEGPSDWVYMMSAKASDVCFPPLLRSMTKYGQYDPIEVDDSWSSNDEPRWVLGNGHHRLVAAILLGWDTVKVHFTSEVCSRLSWAKSDDFDHERMDYYRDCPAVTRFSEANEIARWIRL